MRFRKAGIGVIRGVSKKPQSSQYAEFALIALPAQSQRRVIFRGEAPMQQAFHHAQWMSVLWLHGHQQAGTGRHEPGWHELNTCVA
jgi:hypothetical protein